MKKINFKELLNKIIIASTAQYRYDIAYLLATENSKKHINN